MRYSFLAVAFVCSVCTSFVLAAGGPAITDIKQAGKEYELAGEYAGMVGKEGKTFGVQIIALGKGTFQATVYHGGLPGAGADLSEERIVAQGKLDGDTAVFDGELFAGTVSDGRIVVTAKANNEVVGELQKIHRTSPTLDLKAPAGAVVLFDGSSADSFVGGKLVEENLLGVGCESKQKFGDHTLHLEFRTPFMPEARGQGRGNSGVYVQGRYEVQVLDSFGLTGESNECGGIYQASKPKVNMCLPPLQWQTYDIDFTAAKYDESGKKTANARVTVRHNGVLIHDQVELPDATPGHHKESPQDDGLFLQDHGNPVAFRNVWVVPK